MTQIPRIFLNRIADPRPSLYAQFMAGSEEKPTRVGVEHCLGIGATKKGEAFLRALPNSPTLSEFTEFFRQHGGFEFCKIFHPRLVEARPLIEVYPLEKMQALTDRYKNGGDRAWVIDLNQSKAIYRTPARWLVFGEIEGGPACLTIFLEGDRAGQAFYLTPQPEFNILRPIAKSFNAFLERLGGDVPAFLRLVRACVVLRGADGENYGLRPVRYEPGLAAKS